MPMRILVGFIWDGKSGGIDAYLMAFARVARDEGVNLDFLTNEHCEELGSELDGMGHRLYEIATLHDRSSQRATIFSLCEKNGYDAAYFNVSTALMYPVIKDAKDAGVPKVVVHSHAAGVDRDDVLSRLLFDAANAMFRLPLRGIASDCLACSSSAAAWLFGSQYAISGAVSIVPNPVNVEECEFDADTRALVREKMALSDKFVVGSVTAMKKIKNPYLLIDAFGAFAKTCPEAHLLVVGEGELYGETLGYAKDRLSADSFTFLGKREDVGDLLQSFDVFALTSVREGLSIAAIEAQVSGLPCVLSFGIPDEAVVSRELAVRMPKGCSARVWAEAFADVYRGWKSGVERRSYREDAVNAGYSPESPKKVLEVLGS